MSAIEERPTTAVGKSRGRGWSGTTSSGREGGRGSAAWPAIGLGAIVFGSALTRVVLARDTATPWIAPDEPMYGLLGRSLTESASLVSTGTETAFLTPGLFALALAVTDDVASAVGAVQVLQALLMSATAVIAFVWARAVAGPRWGLLAAFLTVAIPGLAYSALLMTEALFYVAVALALFALARMLERPSLARQAIFVGACAVAVAVRLQGLGLLPAAVLAIVTAAGFERSTSLLRSTAPVLSALLLAGVAAPIALWFGLPVLGVYSESVVGGYDSTDVAVDVFRHLGAAFLIVGGAPLVALAALVAGGRRLTSAPAGLRALVAVAASWAVVVVCQVGLFASQFVGHLAERDLLSIAPPLFVVLAAWLAYGMPRASAWCYLVAFLVSAPAILLPIASFATDEAKLDSFSTMAFRLLGNVAADWITTTVWALWAAFLSLVAMLIRPRARILVGVLTVATLVPLSAVAAADVKSASHADQRWLFSTASPTWVDRHALGPVTYLYTGTGDWGGVWKHAFWNRRIDRIVALDGNRPVPGSIRQTVATIGAAGRLYDEEGDPIETRWVVAPVGVDLQGSVVASIEPSGFLPGLSLWRVDGPATLRSWVQGVYAGGTLLPHAPAFATGWRCSGATLVVSVAAPAGANVRVGALNWHERRVSLTPGGSATVAVPAPPRVGRCDFAIATDAPVTVTSAVLDRDEP